MVVKKLDKPGPSRVSEILSLYENVHNEQLVEDIKTFSESLKMDEDTCRHRNTCVKLITDYLESERVTLLLEDVGIQIRAITAFGSFPTVCATKDSDIDLCICGVTKTKGILPITALQCIYRDLRFSEQAQEHFGDLKPNMLYLVRTAKVPIICFKIDGVAVDLSCNFDSKPPRTSLAAKYINAYCQLDDRFSILVNFLKAWMKSEGDRVDHLRDFPNSYSLILLMIHVLQWYDIFPNIHQTHVDAFNYNSFVDWELVKVGDPNFRTPLDDKFVEEHRTTNPHRHLNIVELLYIFAFHYSNPSLLDSSRFNMKSGDIEKRNSSEHPIQILDPYDQRNPARSARSIHDFVRSLKAFRCLLAYQDPNIFTNLMRITSEKTYNNPDERFLFTPSLNSLPPQIFTPPYMLDANSVLPPHIIQQMQQQYQNNYPPLSIQGPPPVVSSRWPRPQN